MNYEEKYKEALERAKGLYEQGMMPERIEYIFPELKESEDEKIRKELIECLKNNALGYPENTRNKWFAWLKKQGEQKLVLNNALKEAFDKSRKDYSLEEKKEASDYSESIIPTSIAYGESEEEYMLHTIIETAFIAGQNTKQKPDWSEEDEQMLQKIIQYLISLSEGFRVNLDEKVNWLKSLKERYTWKPSDEHLSALNEVINFAASSPSMHWNEYIYGVLYNLWYQLKKLKGE